VEAGSSPLPTTRLSRRYDDISPSLITSRGLSSRDARIRVMGPSRRLRHRGARISSSGEADQDLALAFSDEPDFGPWLSAVIVRLIVGGILAGAGQASDQLSGPFAAVAVGVAAPMVLEQLAGQARLVPAHAVMRSRMHQTVTTPHRVALLPPVLPPPESDHHHT
jgi:hypothetical protein